MVIAIALQGNGSPCGACRQVLSEFGKRFPVLIVDVSKSEIVSRYKLDELLPKAFQLPDRSIE
jgi:cytidine deaminase